MATNPMQRKARNSFLLGMLLMLVIAALIIGILVMQIINLKREEQEREAASTMAYVLARDVRSGEPISEADVVLQQVPVATSPTNVEVVFTENSVAKIDLYTGTVLAPEMIADSESPITDDVRIQEYNMIALPVYLDVNDYVDVRLQMPDGQNYIVISKKRVIDVQENTVWLELTEDEIATMSNAIVEAYIMTGSNLYINRYVEPGMQAEATPTYPPSAAVTNKILEDPNVIDDAKAALRARYNTAQVNLRNNDINSALNQYSETALENIEARIQQETEIREELRNKFLQGLTQ